MSNTKFFGKHYQTGILGTKNSADKIKQSDDIQYNYAIITILRQAKNGNISMNDAVDIIKYAMKVS